MTAPLFNATSDPSTPRLARRHVKYIASVVAVVLVGLFLWAIYAWKQGAEARAIRDLPESEREALYERTLGTLRGPCGAGKREKGLEAFCREQAEFIVQFPECDAACIVLAKQHLTVPSK